MQLDPSGMQFGRLLRSGLPGIGLSFVFLVEFAD